jgi:RNA polymerase sigma-70 factor (ECF subfamily)
VLKPTPSATNEASLAERFRRGDDEAFERIVRENRQVVYLMARRLLRRHEEADEAAQLAFVRAWKSREGFRGASSLRTWLVRITLNVARSMLAARVEAEGVEMLERFPDRRESSEERMRRSQLRARVRGAVERLPQRQREAVLLKVFSEMTYREAAEVMELSEGAVKAHLHQAVGNLRRMVTEVT